MLDDNDADLTFAQIIGELSSPSTCGYDAVVALGQQQLDNALAATYASHQQARVTLSGLSPVSDGIYDAFSMSVAAPMLQFVGEQAQLSYGVYAGSLFQINGEGNPNYMIDFGASGSSLSGAFPLAQATGADQTGSVVIDFTGGGNWSGQLKGVLSGSQEATEIFNAIQGYFVNNPLVYKLGSINTSGTVKALTPTSFTFATQTATNNEGTNLLLLVNTDGSGGANSPSVDIIPSGDSAAVLISNRVIFQEVLPALLTTAMSAQSATFTSTQSSLTAPYVITSTGGALDVGTIQYGNALQGGVWSSDNEGNPADLLVPLSGMTFSGGASGLAFSWTVNWDQYWDSVTYPPPGGVELNNLENVGMQVSGATTLVPSVLSSTADTIAFSGTFNTTTTITTHYNFWQELFEGDVNLGTTVTDPINAALGTWLNGLQVGPVSEFLIDNLLFPSNGQVAITNAAVPCDLYTAGNVQTSLVLSPNTCSLSAGQTATFTLAEPLSSAQWTVTPSLGTIDNGVYTAPAQIPAQVQVVVEVMNTEDIQQVAYAAITLLPTLPALSITPTSVILAPGGGPFPLQAVDANGLVDGNATFTASQGVVKSTLEGGYAYIAPTNISTSTQVTITAISGTNTAEATWTVVPVDQTFNLTASATSVSAGQSVTLTATSQDLSNASWCMAPAFGNVVGSGPMTATYTAPATVSAAQKVTLLAFGGGQALGCAFVTLTVNPAS